jgi:hypothetical protein
MSTQQRRTISVLVVLACQLGLIGAASAQTSASATSGPNLSAPPSQPPIEVAYIPPGPNPGNWMLQVDLIVDPGAGPMIKHFLSPRGATGGPILLDAQQPFPQPLWEDFLNLPVPGTSGVPIIDWHEEIRTPGWEWVLPGDDRFPNLFPANTSLITRDGQPWPWEPIPMPVDPTKLWVRFPPIDPNRVLDVHKALLWVGTPGNRVWGDGLDDAGATVNELFIDVLEYPTIIPEPTTFTLLCLGLIGVIWTRRR